MAALLVVLFMAAVPVVPLAGAAVVLPPRAPLARCAGEGAVRTTVAVSLRGTACWVAVAASCGVTPTVAGADAPAAGAAVWASALAAARAARAARQIDLM